MILSLAPLPNPPLSGRNPGAEAGRPVGLG